MRAALFIIAIATCANANANLLLLKNTDVINVLYTSLLTAIVGELSFHRRLSFSSSNAARAGEFDDESFGESSVSAMLARSIFLTVVVLVR